MAEYAIRPAGPADAESLARVHLSSWRTTYRGIVPESYFTRMEVALPARTQRWRDSLRTVGRHWTLVASVVDGDVVGFARGGAAEPPHFGFAGELGALYLVREHQRRGLGRGLLAAHVRALRRAGYPDMLVWVLSENPSRRFYEHLRGTRLGTAEWTAEGAVHEETAYGWRDLEPLARALDAETSRKPFY